MDGINTEILQVIYSLGFCQCKEFALVGQSRGGRHGEVAVVHLIDDKVGGLLGQRSLVAAPSLGICFCHIDDGGTTSIDTYGFGEDTRSLVHLLLFCFHLECIEHTLQVTFDVSSP